MTVSLVVVSFDPGVTTGWAIHRIPALRLLNEGLVACAGVLQCSVGQINGGSTSDNVDRFLEIARATYERVAKEEDVFVIAGESFTLRMLSMDPTLVEPVRFNAVIEDRLRGTGQGVDWQTPSDALQTINDARLALWGLIDASKHVPDHGRDAQRHGLYYARRWCADIKVRERSGWGLAG